MGDRPVYSKQLDPKGWENAKGTLAKAVIKADVKGSLEKASKAYWDVPWSVLENWTDEKVEMMSAAGAKVTALIGLVRTVEANAGQAIREIDKVPANKLTMKASRAYLEKMQADAKEFAGEAQAYVNETGHAYGAAKDLKARAKASFEGWVELHTRKAEDFLKECLMRAKAAPAAITGKKDDENGPKRSDAKAEQMKYVDAAIAGLNAVYRDGEAEYKALDAQKQKEMLNVWFKFKATQAGQLKQMNEAKAKLAAFN